jgi:hypothetical protein
MSTNGDSNGGGGTLTLANFPQCAKALTPSVAIVVIAMFLVWTITQTIPAISIEVSANTATTMKTQDLLRESLRELQDVKRLLTLNCINTSKDEIGRRECLGIGIDGRRQ